MPRFSAVSEEKLKSCDPKLQLLFNKVIEVWDCSIIVGHRGREAQDAVFNSGLSKLPWPKGKHNSFPSKAVDAAPCPINWKDALRFHLFAGFVLGTAFSLGIKIRWGGDWDQDWDLKDNSFKDLSHFELME